MKPRPHLTLLRACAIAVSFNAAVLVAGCARPHGSADTAYTSISAGLLPSGLPVELRIGLQPQSTRVCVTDDPKACLPWAEHQPGQIPVDLIAMQLLPHGPGATVLYALVYPDTTISTDPPPVSRAALPVTHRDGTRVLHQLDYDRVLTDIAGCASYGDHTRRFTVAYRTANAAATYTAPAVPGAGC